MKGLISTAAMGLLLAGAFGVRARAEEPKKAEAEHEHGGWKDKLGLTDEQQAKLKAARRAQRDAMEPLHAEMKAALNKLSDQLEDKASDKELTDTLDRLKKAHAAMRAAQEKAMNETAQILTPTQRARMALSMSKRMEAMGHGGMGMHGGMMGHGGSSWGETPRRHGMDEGRHPTPRPEGPQAGGDDDDGGE